MKHKKLLRSKKENFLHHLNSAHLENCWCRSMSVFELGRQLLSNMDIVTVSQEEIFYHVGHWRYNW